MQAIYMYRLQDFNTLSAKSRRHVRFANGVDPNEVARNFKVNGYTFR